jgi:thiamine kinase-like enzyme
MAPGVEEIIAGIRPWAAASSVAVVPLPGGLTNRNYRVDVDGEAFHLRIWAERASLLGIDRQREYRCTVAAGRAGVAPEVVYFLPEVGAMVTRFVAGRPLAIADLSDAGTARRVVETIRRCHTGAVFDAAYSPFRSIEAYQRVARRHRAPLPPDIDLLSRRVAEIETATRPGVVVRACHNDLWGPNLIDDGRRVRLVDWEYAGTGDLFFDLANLASYRSSSDDDDAALLHAYFGDASDARFARLKAMRVVVELREALWYLAALTVAAATTDFLPQAAAHFDRCRLALDDPRLPAWLRRLRRGPSV